MKWYIHDYHWINTTKVLTSRSETPFRHDIEVVRYEYPRKHVYGPKVLKRYVFSVRDLFSKYRVYLQDQYITDQPHDVDILRELHIDTIPDPRIDKGIRQYLMVEKYNLRIEHMIEAALRDSKQELTRLQRANIRTAVLEVILADSFFRFW